MRDGSPRRSHGVIAGTVRAQSQGDGNYHFNWKTPSSYSGKCRTMSLNLLDGQSDRLASFRFR
ncbi:MAG: PxKF domain-containing protein [Actinomycetota bacterium]